MRDQAFNGQPSISATNCMTEYKQANDFLGVHKGAAS